MKGGAEPGHCERDAWLDSHDHGLSAPQAGDLSECTQGVAREGVEHVQRGNIDDHSLCPVPPDLVEELRAEPEELAVVERGVEGRDEVPSVAEDRDAQRFLRRVLVNVRHRPT